MAQDSDSSMNKETRIKAGPADEGAAAESTVSEGRRKAIKAGLIGAPLLLTLRSAPAWEDSPAGTVAVTSTPGQATHTSQSRLDPQPTDA
jgi:hypothetical protein